MGSSVEMENEFAVQEEIKKKYDPQLIRKNTKILFDYYCKQQMCLSPNLSFERIERESGRLTIGKLLMMARLMNMLSTFLTK